MSRPIRLGMVGGGAGAFIGAVHRIAARLDGQFVLVAGALSSDPQRGRLSGEALGLDPARLYPDAAAMARAEARRADGIEAVAIVTPNHLHGPAAAAFLRRGIDVICDKPLTATLAQARALERAAARSPALFVPPHTYAGYPMVRQARAMVAQGLLGALRLIQVEYAQDWLATPVEAGGNPQAAWRTDPARAGPGGATGDIGTHAWHLARFVTGLRPQALAADLQAFMPGRRLDDNAHVLLRYAGGARGMLWCSQVATGQQNNLRLRLFGEAGALDWAQEEPDRLWFTPLGAERRLISRMGAGSGPEAARASRVPAGHPEGYLEAFATLYAEAAAAIRARRAGLPAPQGLALPGLRDGLDGMRFVDACVRSSARNAAWIAL
jgi:predicted dehydrogenase